MEEDEKQQFMEMQIAEKQMEQLQQYLENFDTQITNIQEMLVSLEEFEKATAGSKVLMPLHNGIFVEGLLGESKKIKINVGSNVVVEKTIAETKELLSKQLATMQLYKAETMGELEKFSEKLSGMEQQE
ncbi:prefoldin subunit alpha [Candidatus Woesearchaeota archaeon]|nr:MAG: prefoldin subunit alpha [Candidatus Woesearchaeota archaeon]